MSQKSPLMKEAAKLNAGCGRDYRKGWVNLDFRDDGMVDVVHDLTDLPLPFANEHFDYILMRNTMEHLPRQNIRPLMRDFHRILGDNGRLEIIVPWGITFALGHHSFFIEHSLNSFLVNPVGTHARGNSLEVEPIFRCIECKVTPFRIPCFPINIFNQNIRWLLEKSKENITNLP